MSSSKANSAQGKADSSNPKNEASGSNVDTSQKITSFFPVLRGNEGRAKMCATKTGDTKQKEILQKLKNKDAPPPKQKVKSTPDLKSDSPTQGGGRERLSVLSALKTPLSQVLRKSIEASESRKEQVERTKAMLDSAEKKDLPKSSEAVKPTQRAKKSFPVTESDRALRHSQAKVSSSLRSSIRRNVAVDTNSGTNTRRRVMLSDAGEVPSAKNTFSGRVSACASPVEDVDHGTSGQGGSKQKRNRKRHYRGATYGLFLSKKSKKKNLTRKSDECSREGTENSSCLDSEDGNSLMSEDLYTPSEKSLADEDHNTDSRTSPVLGASEKKEEEAGAAVAEGEEAKAEDSSNAGIREENEEVSQNATDMIQRLEEMQWESEAKFEGGTTQYDDISNESFSNSATFPFKSSPPTAEGIDVDGKGVAECTPSVPLGKEEDIVKAEEADASVAASGDTASDVLGMEEVSVGPESPLLDTSGLDLESETPLASVPTSGDENEGGILDGSGAMDVERDPMDAPSTIATCVKSRQRIKRRFTDDIVDTEVGLLSLHTSMAPPRKALPKPDPPKDVIQSFQSVTHSEAKKGPVPKLECIYNHHQEPVRECACEGETFEANLGEEDEPAYCQAVDSIDDKLVGCSNPVMTPRLVRPSVKIPFTIMCEMHLWRLRHHHSCPYCGLFCSQGSFLQCASMRGKQRVVHLYHEQCQGRGEEEGGFEPFCLHCGTTIGMKRVQLEMHMASPPAFHLSQLAPALPQPHENKARISFSVVAELKKGDTELSALEYRIEDTGKVLSSVGLTSGPEKEELDRLLLVLQEEKAVTTAYAADDLYDASAEGNVLKVLNILAGGADPNRKFPDHDSETPLHAAAAAGHTTVVHLLIQAGAVNDALNERILTPLMLAVDSDRKDVVFYLVKNSAVADFKGEGGMSSFHMAARNGNLEILQTLLMARDVDINSQDDGGWTPIVWASEHDHFGVVKYLLKRGANPNIKDNEGNTGLHWSAYSGSMDICFLYLDYGCDINAVNELGDTPLHIAARQDSLPCVTLFLSRGADVQIKNKSDLIPAECVIDKNSDTYLSLSLNMLLKKIAGKYQHKAEKILLKDISRGKEQIAIQCVNEVDDEPPPLDFLYVTENCETTPMKIDRTITSLQSCHCEDDCSTSNCTCASISYQCWYDKDGLLLPHFNLLDPPMLFECNRACSCWSLNCRNRVLQNGMTCRLQLIRTKGKGWGVRTLKDIPKGTFICEYVGEMISDSAADKRADDSYLFDLDNRDGETYCLDARYYGNISRFINHLCEPNLVPVKVYVDHQDLNFPRIAFFSSRDIKQYEELGFDYCEKFWVIKYKYFTCDCGSAKCKYSKDTIHTTLANYYRRVREEQMMEEGGAHLAPPPPPTIDTPDTGAVLQLD